jgi:glycerol-3-phosphate dehydrogenase
VNAGGPFVDEVRRLEKGKSVDEKLIDRVAGAHLNVFPAVTDESYYITAGDGRLVFVLKRNEDGLVYSRIGTTERTLLPNEPTDAPNVTELEETYLKNLVLEFFPSANISDETLISKDAGVRPLMHQSADAEFQKSREHRIVQENRVVHVVGVKLTDFRKVSEEVANAIPWSRHHVTIESGGLGSEAELLRDLKSPWAYAEETVEEIVMSTMVVKAEDYVLRRRGLRPRVLEKKDPEKLGWEIRKLNDLLR